MVAISYQCIYGHKHLINQCQTNGPDHLSMSLQGHKNLIDQGQTNESNQLSMSLQRHKHLIDQGQTNGGNQLSMSLQGHKHLIDQCQTNGHDHQLICLEQGYDYSLAVKKSESLYQLMYLRFISYKLKLIDVITLSTSLYLSHD